MGKWPAGGAPDHKLLDRGRRETRGARVLVLLTFSEQNILQLSLGYKLKCELFC